jgi:diguanylate cyclase (GGDEF)-like protein
VAKLKTIINQLGDSTTNSRFFKFTLVFICLSLIVALGLLRMYTQAQFAFSSLMLYPVLISAWLTNRVGGLLSSFLAGLIWGWADFMSATSLDPYWIIVLNTLICLTNFIIVAELALRARLLLQSELNNARIDHLTGLKNRLGFIEALEENIRLAQRLNLSLYLMFIDLDCFKELNDIGGHLKGDAALKLVGTTLRKTVRSTDTAARFGGDEFCVVGFSKSVDHAEKEALRIHARIKNKLVKYPPTGLSIGVAFFANTEQLVVSHMIQEADQTMYAVKKDGKDSVLCKSF